MSKCNFIAAKHFGPEIDITDPGYDRDVWCRMNNVKVKEREYRCAIWPMTKTYVDDNGKRHRSTRVSRIGIYFDKVPDEEVLVKIGEIGVDAGLAGFFNHKPDYNEKEWYAFCEACAKGDYHIIEEGFFSSSGYGDGFYPVYAEYNENNEIISLEIAFM